MSARLEQVIKQLSPQQVDALIQRAEAMVREPRVRGRKLRLDWADCIDSEHTSGMDAQRDAMRDWTRATERSMNG